MKLVALCEISSDTDGEAKIVPHDGHGNETIDGGSLKYPLQPGHKTPTLYPTTVHNQSVYDIVRHLVAILI